jgi:hypothetical protein
MDTAKPSKFCLKSKNMSKPNLYLKESLCGDYGVLPYDSDADLDTPALTIGHRPGASDSAPYYLSIRATPASLTMVLSSLATAITLLKPIDLTTLKGFNISFFYKKVGRPTKAQVKA